MSYCFKVNTPLNSEDILIESCIIINAHDFMFLSFKFLIVSDYVCLFFNRLSEDSILIHSQDLMLNLYSDYIVIRLKPPSYTHPSVQRYPLIKQQLCSS